MSRKLCFILTAITVLAVFAGCSFIPSDEPITDADIRRTADVVVEMTLTAEPTPTPYPTLTPMSTFTAEPTYTPLAPLPTYTPFPTYTPVPAAGATESAAQGDPTAEPTAVEASGGESAPAISTDVGPGVIPEGKWLVRSYDTDDRGFVFVNGELVAISYNDHDTDWVDIADYMLPLEYNTVAFAYYNTKSSGAWGFGVRQDDTTLWGAEGTTGNDYSLAYTQIVHINEDGSVEAIEVDTSDRTPPPGKWEIRIQNAASGGACMVNGSPVAVSAGSSTLGWVDVTNLLYSDRYNIINCGVWNVEGDYAWDVAVKLDDVVIWGSQESGAGKVDRVYQETVVILPDGVLQNSIPAKPFEDYSWSVKTYRTDDAASVFVNGNLVIVSQHGRDSDWVDITDYLDPEQPNLVALSSYNRSSRGSWGFSVRRDNLTVWGTEGDTGNDYSFAYAQQVVINPDGTVETLAPDVSLRTPPPGKWYVRAQLIRDVGGILVNGQPVSVAHNNDERDWVDITGLLYSDRDNIITVAVWNFEGDYSWDLSIKQDDSIVWAVSNTGSGQTDLVLQHEVTITGDGTVVP